MPELPPRAWLSEHQFSGPILIGLVSDTHVPEARRTIFDEVYAAFKGVDLILHGGDMHDKVVLDWLEDRCGVPVLAACGNGDDGSSGRSIAPDDHRLSYNHLLHIDGLRVGTTHDFPDRPTPGSADTQERMRRHFGGPCHVVVAGDTHVPLVKTWEGTLIVNSGSPLYPRNLLTQLGTVGFLEVRNGRVDAWIEQLH
ncbi:MAG: metallophosphoesterase [Dehalococcoidia bacterium]|nr:metallophosphoesterase [Dehalococcoidia bacterium]